MELCLALKRGKDNIELFQKFKPVDRRVRRKHRDKEDCVIILHWDVICLCIGERNVIIKRGELFLPDLVGVFILLWE